MYFNTQCIFLLNFFTNMGAILMMSSKLTTLGVLKRKMLWKNIYDVLISVYDVTNKVLSRGSNYVADMVMWLKFANFSISMRRCYELNFTKSQLEKPFYEQCSWFKFTNLGLALSTTFESYSSMGKGLKIKVGKLWGSYICRSYSGNW